MSFSVDKVTTGTYHFVSVILNPALVGLSIAATAEFTSGSASLVALLVNTQFSDHVKLVKCLMAQQFQLLFLCFYLLISL